MNARKAEHIIMAENELQSAIQGLKSHVRDVREEARNTLDRLAREITIPNVGKHDISPEAFRDSIRFSFEIYKEFQLA